jgi:hypothetical protein
MVMNDKAERATKSGGHWSLLPLLAIGLVLFFEMVERQSGQSAGVWLVNLAMAALILALPVALVLLLIRALR